MIHIHPDRKLPQYYHDIALVKLQTPIIFSFDIRPACLHPKFDLPKSLEVAAIGWGKSEFDGSHSTILNKVYLDLFTNKECNSVYYTSPPVRSLPFGIFDRLIVCAGGKRSARDTCQGDSGNAIQFFDKGRNIYYLIGITSFGKSCGIVGVPAGYTRIAAYIPWIESIVWP